MRQLREVTSRRKSRTTDGAATRMCTDPIYPAPAAFRIHNADRRHADERAEGPMQSPATMEKGVHDDRPGRTSTGAAVLAFGTILDPARRSRFGARGRGGPVRGLARCVHTR